MMDADLPSLRPYLVRAVHEWCTDHGFTPYMAVAVDARVQVPREYVRNGEIILNVSYDATANLRIDNEVVTFRARFGGVPRDVVVPIGNVVGIYARENGQGLAFPHPDPVPEDEEDGPVPPVAPGKGPQRLQVVTPSADEPPAPTAGQTGDGGVAHDGDEPPPSPPRGGRPALKRVK
ncbi:ClpXP protease specificity-enhancing factor [Tepidimonas aquatica]|uniref:Stringent starvation protein B n=1 Tax=Tepidimonas aquatica TaxID=247482 RepID=A0A554WFV0_9BURK|nr:ClpXP protease specificity-enhancing factor [Tepidimonas aquatica]TSE22458.1 Stringent starvation protein B [Tepidimonas aquatica]